MVTSTGDEIDKRLPSVQIKKLFNEGKLSSSEERSLQEFCSQCNVDETTCKSYVEHLEFKIDAKAKKKSQRKGTLPSNISWKYEKDVEPFTNNQLKMYLKQHGLKTSGGKADLTKRVLSHARGNAARDVQKMKNLIIRVKTTQLQNQSQVIPMERTHTMKSNLNYFL